MNEQIAALQARQHELGTALGRAIQNGDSEDAKGKIEGDIDAVSRDIARLQKLEIARADAIKTQLPNDAEIVRVQNNDNSPLLGFEMHRSTSVPIITLARQRQAYMARRSGADPREISRVITTSTSNAPATNLFMNMFETAEFQTGGLLNAVTVINDDNGRVVSLGTGNDTSRDSKLKTMDGTTDISAVSNLIADISFGKVDFSAYNYASATIVERTAIQDSVPLLEGILSSSLQTAFAAKREALLAVGTGSSQPQGLFVGASAGVTATATTEVTDEELLDLIGGTRGFHRTVGQFAMSAATLYTKLIPLKGGDGHYLLLDKHLTRVGTDWYLFGHRIVLTDFAPAMTTGLVPIVFGNLSKLFVRMVGDVELVRDYTGTRVTTNTILFMVQQRMDSRVVNAGDNPIRKITMA